MEDNPIRVLFERVKGLFADMLERQDERALSVNEIAMRAEEQLPDFAWVHDMFFNEAGAPFVIYSNEGRLFKAPVMVSGDEVTVGESQQVVQDFRPVGEMRTNIIRQADGRYRWFSKSATAVLNRVGEIDSRDLFDSFISHAQETGEYPYRTFFHQGEKFRTGQADFLARDDYIYITSGLYDDNDLAQAEIEARERDPDYYGESIGFRATSAPDFIDVEGVEIPVYTQGINVEISTLPEHKAASWYTNTVQEVSRMALRQEVQDELLKLYGGDEARMNTFLSDIDATNREIEDEELLTRAQEDVDNSDESEQEQEMETETDDDDEQESETDDDENLVEVDDELLETIADKVEQSLTEQLDAVTATLEEISRKLEQVNNDLVEVDQRISQNASKADERFRVLERTDDERVRDIADDMPARSKTRVTYRPRTADKDEREMSLSERAESFDWGAQ